MAFRVWMAAVLLPAAVSCAADAPAAKPDVLARLPVRELTVFKDGHAFVLHQGSRPVDAQGRVRLDYLPTPVIGTFWAFSNDKAAKVTSVTAGRHTVRIERTALTVPDLLEANVGKAVVIHEGDNKSYEATVVGFLTRTSKELEATSPPATTTFTPQRSNLVMLKTAEGTRIVSVERIVEVKFPGEYGTKLAAEEERNLLTLQLSFAEGKKAATADVGMAYLQKGVRWIPSYRVELDDGGKAVVKLQATLLNELADIEDATVNLVVGVPTFHFKETIDPISLGQTIAQLSPYFEQNTLSNAGFSNSIMTQMQMPRMREVRQPAGDQPMAIDLGPDVAGSGQNEDLYVFTVRNVSLKRGERMVIPVSEHTLPYTDVFVLDLPYAPPPGIEAQLNDERQREVAALMAAPKVMHKVRLTNSGRQPLTTAPALVVRGTRVLAQTMMTYTSPGGTTDLGVTTAVDIKARKSEKETKRTPNAAVWHGTPVQKIDIAGKIALQNLRSDKAEIEIVRHVLGHAVEADHEGKAEMLNALESSEAVARPVWWAWYSWPGWWYSYNGVGEFTWKVTLDKGQSVELGYTWNYFAP